MVADGLALDDVERAAELTADDWFGYWMERCDDYERRGQEALDEGSTISGGNLLWLASLCAHYAQYIWWKQADVRQQGQDRKVELYRRAAPHLDPPAERVDIPFEDATIPAYLRLPARGSAPFPCVVLIGGLESTKEESRLFEELCLARGMATFAFDGPGQGELFPGHGLQPGFERWTSRVVDYLEGRDEIDAGKLGVLGRSLGGYYAPRSAAADHRFAACVAWGACYDLSEFDQMKPELQDGFIYVTGVEDRDEARRVASEAIDLSDVVADLRAPTYVLHGAHDDIFSVRHVERLREAAVNAPLDIDVEPDGDHCCHELAHLVRPRMADWLAKRLVAGENLPPGRESPLVHGSSDKAG
jgi:2,6-dihydroxypseudooxynicotine hydrolase